MKSTKEIKEKLDECTAELTRMNKMAESDENISDKPFIFSDGSSYKEILFREVLTQYVSEKRMLKWVLNHGD